MGLIISAYDSKKINITPSSKKEEIIQNVAMVLSTPKFAVPFNRGFGLAQEFLDQPIGVAQAVLTAEIFEAVEREEPRVKVKEVNFEESESPGKLVPRVEVDFVDG